MLIDAVVLAGGRSSRLGGAPKPALIYQGESLLERTVRAVLPFRRVVVVGVVPPTVQLPDAVLVTREEPPFSGPAAAIAAGLHTLDTAVHGSTTEIHPADAIVVVACDMPEVAEALDVLRAALPLDHGADGLVAVDEDNRQQPLVAVYRASALRSAVESFADSGALEGLSVRALLGALRLVQLPVPPRSTADVDTPLDAAAFGITPSADRRDSPEETP